MLTTAEVAGIHGVHQKTIQQAVKDGRITGAIRGHHNMYLIPEDSALAFKSSSHVSHDLESIKQRRDVIAKMTQEGCSLDYIAVTLGITVRSVQRGRRALGIAQDPHLPLSEDEKAEVLRLLEDGAAYPEVARTVGRSPKTIMKHFPGYTKTRAQCGELAAMGRKLRQVTRTAEWNWVD